MEGLDSVKKLSEVAAKEPTKFDAGERSSFIRAHVTQIKRMIENKYSIDDIKSAFPQFCEEYPSLLEMITRPSYDEKSLTMMMTMLDRMNKTKLSQHEASIKVGTQLVETYVKPQLDQL